MKVLDLITHAENKISIMHCISAIDISNSKLNPLFKLLLDITDSVYFYGLRVVVADDELAKDVGFVAEEVFINENHNSILLWKQIIKTY